VKHEKLLQAEQRRVVRMRRAKISHSILSHIVRTAAPPTPRPPPMGCIMTASAIVTRNTALIVAALLPAITEVACSN